MKIKLKRTIAGFLSVLVAFSMLISGQIPLLVKAEEPGNSDSGIEVSFVGGTVVGISDNTITYKVGEKLVNVEVGVVSGSSIVAAVSDSSVVVPYGKEDEVTFTLDENYDPTSMKVKVYGVNNFNTTLTVTDHKTTLADIPAETYLTSSVNFMVELENGGGEETVGEGSWENAYDPYLSEGINILSTWIGSSEGKITYEFSNDKDSWTGPKAELSRTAIEGWLSTLQSTTATEEQKQEAKSKLFGITPSGQYMKLTAGEDLGGNHLGFEVFQKNSEGNLVRQEDVKISYYDYRTGGFVTMSDDNRDWEDYMKCKPYLVDGVDTPTKGLIIDLNSMPANYILRGVLPFDSRKNISWWNAKYKEQVEAAGDHVSDDNWVKNGTVELVKVVSGDGSDVYYSNEPGWHADPGMDENFVVFLGKAGYDFGDNTLRPGYDGAHGGFSAEEMLEAAEKASGQCNVPVNSLVTVKLTPDPGYQILSASLNGMPLIPDEKVTSQFTFKITSNLHFSAVFEKASDVVSIAASEVSGAQITGTENAVETGNVALTVADDTDYDDTAAMQVVSGTKVVSLDVTVNQIVAKAGKLSETEQYQAKNGSLAVTEEKFWRNRLAELENPVNVALNLDGVTLAADETLAIVRDHSGEYTEVPVMVEKNNNDIVVNFSSDKFSTYTIIKKKVTIPSGDSGTGGTNSGVSSGVAETPEKPSTPDTTVITNPDGTTTETKTEVVKNEVGNSAEVTTITQKDGQGNVTGITQVTVIDQIIKNADAKITVEKNAAGEITNAQAEVTKTGSTGKTGITATLDGSVVSQIIDAAGTESVAITMTVSAGTKKFVVKADTGDINEGNKLKVFVVNKKTGKYVLVNAKTYTVSEKGNVKLTLPKGETYQLMDTKEAASVEKAILNTVKLKKTSVTVKKGNKITVQLNSKLDMDNVAKITYSSGNKTIATVSKSGKVTAKKTGTVSIEAKVTLKNGKTKTVTLKVGVN
ncbi:Ig-like domain-containing protein [Velocimicrobium porci]|uniref:BIG2 domain-containing protein n=1 Tax=Velocimicrobium porci TaxID=2606634 RepID=A0A6L5Y1Y1_9FIRM|nr:Ig-like domain-containing protein [Velocimicrobium porci]MSS64867.1 hypothetical protein [Velocimicrobium porci]